MFLGLIENMISWHNIMVAVRNKSRQVDEVMLVMDFNASLLSYLETWFPFNDKTWICIMVQIYL